MLQLLQIKEPTNRWHWLYPLQNPGVPLAKTTLAKHCAEDLSFMKFLCVMNKKIIKVLCLLFCFVAQREFVIIGKELKKSICFEKCMVFLVKAPGHEETQLNILGFEQRVVTRVTIRQCSGNSKMSFSSCICTFRTITSIPSFRRRQKIQYNTLVTMFSYLSNLPVNRKSVYWRLRCVLSRLFHVTPGARHREHVAARAAGLLRQRHLCGPGAVRGNLGAPDGAAGAPPAALPGVAAVGAARRRLHAGRTAGAQGLPLNRTLGAALHGARQRV